MDLLLNYFGSLKSTARNARSNVLRGDAFVNRTHFGQMETVMEIQEGVSQTSPYRKSTRTLSIL